ncbi:MAG: COX15/CtaA family protein [Thermaerobacter sp.]|nr:COX15/CtaA family protein [Thermaerobacter sp.]
MSREPSRSLLALRRWTDVATVGLFVVILIGFLDTFTFSAEGCGIQWPLCDGGVTPGPGLRSEVEYWHRAITGLVGMLVVVVAIWAWRRYRHPLEVRLFAAICVVFVVVQAALGAAAIFAPESAALLASHFGFALLAFSGIGLLDVVLRQRERPNTGWEFRQRGLPPNLARYIWLVLLYTLGLIYWGTYVAHRGAGEACQGWPLCNGQLWPGFHGLETLIFAHRLGALADGLLLAGLYWVVQSQRQERPDLWRGAQVALGMVALQIASGAYLILSHLSVNAEMLHVALVTILFFNLAYLGVQTLPSHPRQADAPGATL